MPVITQVLLIALLAFFTGYLIYEVVRWQDANRGGLTIGQFRRRIIGGALLELDLVLWLLYQPLISPLHARYQLLYLLACMLLTLVPMLLAVREAAYVTRQYVRWRGEVVRKYAPNEGEAGHQDVPRS